MKVSKKELQKIIKEEITRILSEFNGPPDPRDPSGIDAARRAGGMPGGPKSAAMQSAALRRRRESGVTGHPHAPEKPDKRNKSKLTVKSIERARKVGASGKVSTGEAAALDDLNTQFVQGAEIHGALEKDPAVKRYMALLAGAIGKLIGASQKKEEE
jgi:hypothetical protein